MQPVAITVCIALHLWLCPSIAGCALGQRLYLCNATAEQIRSLVDARSYQQSSIAATLDDQLAGSAVAGLVQILSTGLEVIKYLQVASKQGQHMMTDAIHCQRCHAQQAMSRNKKQLGQLAKLEWGQSRFWQ